VSQNDRQYFAMNDAKNETMNLPILFSKIISVPFIPTELAQRPIKSLCFDSRKIETDSVFVAIKGEKSDGHAYLNEACLKQALAVVVQNRELVPANFKGLVVEVKDTRQVLNQLAARWNDEPAKKMVCIGVTGTNGKTTTTHMLESILNLHGLPTGVIGTINHHLGERIWKTEMTTPDPIQFQERLADFVAYGAKAVALEVSSHALRQCRVDEVPFDVAVFTNLSRDHLDYHVDMDDYFLAKAKLFNNLLVHSTKPQRFAVINGDDERAKELSEIKGVTCWMYGQKPEYALSFQVLEQGFTGTRFRLRSPVAAHKTHDFHEGHEFNLQMTGLHNVYNAVAAIGAALAVGVSLQTCAKALSKLVGVSGRLEAVPNERGIHVFVDYAHTDDALKMVLRQLISIRENSIPPARNRIMTVFGCGGDRDKGKRPLMLKAAIENSDIVILTSDNPRTENPQSIIDDALAGIEPEKLGKTLLTNVDRRQAIQLALELAKPGDVVLIAGKGHETYQQIGTTKYPFSDFETAARLLSELPRSSGEKGNSGANS
jgi:UDP-N-acetylmuramoyl-L-alanyl-D-glutamate--2,6-diaminopimelate ligase